MQISEIYTIALSGGDFRELTRDGSSIWKPMWTADGNRIVFMANRNGSVRVWQIPATGGRIEPETVYPMSGAKLVARRIGHLFCLQPDRSLAGLAARAITGKEAQITRAGGFAAFESFDAKTLYYSRFDSGGLWSVPVGGGAEQHLTDAPRRFYWGHFAVIDTGLYLLETSTEPGPTILYYEFRSRRLKPMLMMKQSAEPRTANLSASRDGRMLLFAQYESRNSIMMADDLQ